MFVRRARPFRSLPSSSVSLVSSLTLLLLSFIYAYTSPPPQDVILSTLYVACKMHDTLKKPRDIILASYSIRFPEKANKGKGPAGGGTGVVGEGDVDPAVSSVHLSPVSARLSSNETKEGTTVPSSSSSPLTFVFSFATSSWNKIVSNFFQ